MTCWVSASTTTCPGRGTQTIAAVGTTSGRYTRELLALQSAPSPYTSRNTCSPLVESALSTNVSQLAWSQSATNVSRLASSSGPAIPMTDGHAAATARANAETTSVVVFNAAIRDQRMLECAYSPSFRVLRPPSGRSEITNLSLDKVPEPLPPLFNSPARKGFMPMSIKARSLPPPSYAPRTTQKQRQTATSAPAPPVQENSRAVPPATPRRRAQRSKYPSTSHLPDPQNARP